MRPFPCRCKQEIMSHGTQRDLRAADGRHTLSLTGELVDGSDTIQRFHKLSYGNGFTERRWMELVRQVNV